MTLDKFTVEWTETATGTKRRVSYGKTPSGDFTRLEEEHRDGDWRAVGIETVADLDISGELPD